MVIAARGFRMILDFSLEDLFERWLGVCNGINHVIVPKGMKLLGACVIKIVAAEIIFQAMCVGRIGDKGNLGPIRRVKPLSHMERLMEITDEMNQPGKCLFFFHLIPGSLGRSFQNRDAAANSVDDVLEEL